MTPLPSIHNAALRPLVRPEYRPADLARVRAFLDTRGTLEIRPKPNGLYSAVAVGAPSAARYAHVWVRDTVMIVSHLRELGRRGDAAHTMGALRAYFARHLARFDRILEGRADPADPMARPRTTPSATRCG
jgi:hypothetical protein